MDVIVLVILSLLIVQTSCENCIYAPSCPDLITYKSGYICEENQMPIIKIRLINGLKIKTICCKENSCSFHPWCAEKSSIIMSSKSTITCSSNCQNTWFKYFQKSFLPAKALNAGSFAPGISSYIGRTFKNGNLQIGRFQNVPPNGLFYTLDGEINFESESIEILSNGNFLWKNSSHGKFERNAVTVNGLKAHQLPFYIARHIINGQTHVGVVIRVLGLMYYIDENGVERSTDCYEVLSCNDEELSSNEGATTDSNLTSVFFEDLTISPINSEITTLTYSEESLMSESTTSSHFNGSIIAEELLTTGNSNMSSTTHQILSLSEESSTNTDQELSLAPHELPTSSHVPQTQIAPLTTDKLPTFMNDSITKTFFLLSTQSPLTKTTTKRKKFTRTTRSRPTRTSLKTKTTKASSINSWMVLTNTSTVSIDGLNNIQIPVIIGNSTQNINGFLGCKLNNL